mmetsp:Transcript_58700/g.191434  ORF Transcript_58700/g.191434 Transcript_58700/m.191434 type:complete len:97 (-) Transcript_58700:57-347(-)
MALPLQLHMGEGLWSWMTTRRVMTMMISRWCEDDRSITNQHIHMQLALELTAVQRLFLTCCQRELVTSCRECVALLAASPLGAAPRSMALSSRQNP